MLKLRAATSGGTTAWGPFSSLIGTPRLAIRVGAAASTIIRCNGAGGKMRHAARRPHVASLSIAPIRPLGGDFRSAPGNGHRPGRSACLKPAKNRTCGNGDLWRKAAVHTQTGYRVDNE